MIKITATAELPDVPSSNSNAFEAIAKHVAQSVRDNFEQSGRPRRWMRLKYGSHKPLVKSGALMNSVTYRFTENSATIEAGAGLPYASIQNFGGITHPTVTKKMLGYLFGVVFKGKKRKGKSTGLTIGSKMTIRIPARPFMVLQDEDIKYIKERIAEAIITTSFQEFASLTKGR